MLVDIHVPPDAATAVGLLAAGATACGGGTILLPRHNDFAGPPTELVSLRRAGLAGVELDGATVRIGAATTLAQLQDDDRLALLEPVVRSIASLPVRTLATVAGNIFARQPYGDLAVALVALGATASILDEAGARTVPVESLIGKPAPGLVTEISFDLPPAGAFRYLKAARRTFNSGSIVTVAAVITESDGTVETAQVALGGVVPQVVRARAVEQQLVGARLDAASVAAAADAGRAEIAPSDDAYASAWYRDRVFGVHLRRALLGH